MAKQALNKFLVKAFSTFIQQEITAGYGMEKKVKHLTQAIVMLILSAVSLNFLSHQAFISET